MITAAYRRSTNILFFALRTNGFFLVHSVFKLYHTLNVSCALLQFALFSSRSIHSGKDIVPAVSRGKSRGSTGRRASRGGGTLVRRRKAGKFRQSMRFARKGGRSR